MASRAGAARQLVLRYVADAREFIRGTDQATEALDDQAREAAALERALEKLDRQYAETGRGADKMGRDVRQAGDGIAQTGTEVGQEFSQNLGEALKSGDPLEAVTETALSLGGMFGAAGVAAAAGVGLVAGAITSVARETEKAKQAADTWFERIRDVADQLAGVWKQEAIQDAIKNLGGGFTADGWIKAEQQARQLGLTTAEYAAYLGGVSDRQAEITALVEAHARADVEKARAAQGYGSSLEGSVALEQRALELAQQNADARQRAADAARIEREATGRTAEYAREIARAVDERWASVGYGAAYASSGANRPGG